MLENEWNEEEIKKFEMENPELLNNDLVISFLRIPINKEMYMKTISNPTPENMKELDILFKHFYFKIRFISHISTTLKFNSINYDKRLKVIQSRFTSTLNAPINTDGGEETFLDLLAAEESYLILDEIVLEDEINEHVTCPLMNDALYSLTEKQKQIINLVYIKGFSDTEIGQLLNISQQAVSKTHKKALKNIREYIETHKDKKGGI